MCVDGLGLVDLAVSRLIPVPSQWPEFFSWAASAFALDQDDSWNGAGQSQPWLSSLPYGKMINSIYLLAYALSDNYQSQWHSLNDYLTSARAEPNVYHGPFYLRFKDDTGEADSETGRVLARDRTNMHCQSFNYPGASDDPANRASVLVHESWHHWQYHNGYNGDHLTGGAITQQEGDYYYFHRVGDFDFGVLWKYQLSPLRFHSPYQVQCEYLADLAEFSVWWLPKVVAQSARDLGNKRLGSQFFNAVAYRIGDPRPF